MDAAYMQLAPAIGPGAIAWQILPFGRRSGPIHPKWGIRLGRTDGRRLQLQIQSVAWGNLTTPCLPPWKVRFL